ncbi:hypothetical protein ACFQZK_14060 [Rhodococcus aetherivorans]
MSAPSELTEGRAAHDEETVAEAHAVGEIRRAARELQDGELPVDVVEVHPQVCLERGPVEVLPVRTGATSVRGSPTFEADGCSPDTTEPVITGLPPRAGRT